MINDNLLCLRQAEELLIRIGDEHYRSRAPCFMATIGTHFRHVGDHYLQFVDGIESGVVNYDERRRDANCEGHRPTMIMLLRQIQRDLDRLLREEAHDRSLCVISRTTAGDETSMSSTVIRELHFLHSHTIHHFAQIAAQLRFLEVTVDQEFGVAPATSRFRQSASV